MTIGSNRALLPYAQGLPSVGRNGLSGGTATRPQAPGAMSSDRALFSKTATVSASQPVGLPLDRALMPEATTRNVIDFHLTAEDSFKAILDAVAGAKSSFHIETFIWHDDESGRELAKALVDRVKRAQANGERFDAKVLIDSFGLKYGDLGTQDSKIVDYLRANGVEVQILNPRIVSLKAMGVPITHRKLFIADGEQYVIGGRNVGNEYFRSTFDLKHGDPTTSMNSLHDLMMTVRGEEAARIEGEFYENWGRAGGKVPAELPNPVPAAGGTTAIQTFVTDPLQGEHTILDVQLKAIASAKKEIFLLIPYLADKQLIEALSDAKRKNPALSIKVLLPSNGEMGKKNLNYEMNMSSARTLLAAGVEVRLTPGGIADQRQIERFSHVKAMIVDDEILSVGSANADHRSFHSNHEILNLVADRQKVGEFKQRLATPDWEAATPIDQGWLKANTTWLERVVQWLGRKLSFLY